MDLDRMGYMESDAFGGFSLKKFARGVKKSFSSPKAALTTIGKAVVAPIIVPTAMTVKATTYVAGKTGFKPLKKLDSATGRVYRGGFMKSTRDIYATQLAIGAVIGGAIVAAPAIGAAAGSISTTGAIEAAGVAASLVGGGAAASASSEPTTSPAEAVQSAAMTQAAGGPSPIADTAKFLAPAGIGFLVGGPVGLAAGLGVALAMKLKKGGPVGPTVSVSPVEKQGRQDLSGFVLGTWR